MKILHVASFIGNIGDNASHMGLYKILNKYFINYEIEKVEIRKFYKNYKHSDKMFFDKEFIEYVNNFDLMIIGGGGFLDYWVEGSKTGTTIDIAPNLLSLIKIPTLITSVGCIPHKNVPPGNIEKFRRFLDEVNLCDNILISVRNDGSVKSLIDNIGSKYLNNISEVLDNGFFYDSKVKDKILSEDKYIAINITEDQIKMKSEIRDEIDKDKYLKSLSKVVNYICNDLNMGVVFVPHIYSDIKAVSELIDYLDKFLVRKYLSVAPYMQGDKAANKIFSIYKKSELVIGTRFHSNVCSLSMGVPTIGIAALDRVIHMYDSIGLKNNIVMIDGEMSENLISKIDKIINNKIEQIEIIDGCIKTKRKETLKKYKYNFKNIGLLINE